MMLTKSLAMPSTNKRLESNKIVTMQNRYKWHIPSGRVEFADSWFISLGYNPDELPHHVDTWKSLVHPDDMPLIWAELEPCLKGETKKFKAINRLKMKDGSYRWNLDHGKIVERDEEGNAIIMEGFDIPLAC